MYFFVDSKQEKYRAFRRQERAIDTPKPRYIFALKNCMLGIFTGCPLPLVRQLRW